MTEWPFLLLELQSIGESLSQSHNNTINKYNIIEFLFMLFVNNIIPLLGQGKGISHWFASF